MNTYTVTVSREDDLWVAVITGVGATDTPRFEDLETEVLDYIAGMTDTDPEDLTLQWRYLVGDRDVSNVVCTWLNAARALRRLQETAAVHDQERLNLVRELAGPLSQRTLADMLGVSHQRVNQLAKEARAPHRQAATGS